MKIQTHLFGTQDVRREQILHFPMGVIGLEEDHQWMLLGDQEQPALAWLQSLSTPDANFPVISPRRFFSDYQLFLDSSSLAPLHVAPQDQLYVLALVSHLESCLTANLRAPIVLNVSRQLGRQVITVDNQPMREVIGEMGNAVRRSA